MNLYAIKDRLIDYFMDPFVAPNDENVKASLSNVVTNGDSNSAIAQAPHHFELWKIAEIKDGHVTPAREFLCDASTLIRYGGPETRRQSAQSGTAAPQGVAHARPGSPDSPQRSTGAPEQTHVHPMAPTGSEAVQAHQPAPGGNN